MFSLPKQTYTHFKKSKRPFKDKATTTFCTIKNCAPTSSLFEKLSGQRNVLVMCIVKDMWKISPQPVKQKKFQIIIIIKCYNYSDLTTMVIQSQVFAFQTFRCSCFQNLNFNLISVHDITGFEYICTYQVWSITVLSIFCHPKPNKAMSKVHCFM